MPLVPTATSAYFSLYFSFFVKLFKFAFWTFFLGESVGIDFGYAFDVSVEFLPVPEVVPIRLTPQIAEVTEPIGILGNNYQAYILW